MSTEPHCSVCGLIPLAWYQRGGTAIVAHSPAMQATMMRVARFAPSDAPVVVLGETGTGKEVLARALHANGPRGKEPFVAVNVAALPGELLESELLGHAKGAFTGAAGTRRGLVEAAHQGTLFLDEIGEMPLPLQAKLLRVLQDGEIRRVGETRPFIVDVRVVCATHRDLAQLVRDGVFREDLYYRLKVLTLRVPSLRERTEDVLPLAMSFLAGERTAASTFSAAACHRLQGYAWPGNVRELQNAVKHGAALATGPTVQEVDLPEELFQRPQRAPADVAPAPRPARTSEETPPLRTLAEVERDYIQQVLEQCGGSQSEAARVLGIGRNTLWRKLRESA